MIAPYLTGDPIQATWKATYSGATIQTAWKVYNLIKVTAWKDKGDTNGNDD